MYRNRNHIGEGNVHWISGFYRFTSQPKRQIRQNLKQDAVVQFAALDFGRCTGKISFPYMQQPRSPTDTCLLAVLMSCLMLRCDGLLLQIDTWA